MVGMDILSNFGRYGGEASPVPFPIDIIRSKKNGKLRPAL
jgi:hypothetical protein